MFRNNYDNDSVTFSPQGRIFQVEYASEAVKQGSVVVGIVSKTHAVLVALKRNAEELSSYQKKLFTVDEHLGVAIAGLTSDARVLENFARRQCLSHRLTYDRSMPVKALVDLIGEKAQVNTQHYGKRPYGVGLLIAGLDDHGPHLFEFQPSGMTEEMSAFAIGARSQMARTYLEKNLDAFGSASREQLIRHGLRALKESLVQDRELTIENTSVAVVGYTMGKPSEQGGKPKKVVEPFKVYDGQEVKAWIDSVADDKEGGGDDDDDDDDEEMEVDA